MPENYAAVSRDAVDRYRERVHRSIAELPLEQILWGAVIAGLAADLISTTAGLQAGLTEGNPLVRWGLSVWGPAALVGLKIPIVGVALGLRAYRVDFGVAAGLALAVLWNGVALANVAAIL